MSEVPEKNRIVNNMYRMEGISVNNLLQNLSWMWTVTDDHL